MSPFLTKWRTTGLGLGFVGVGLGRTMGLGEGVETTGGGVGLDRGELAGRLIGEFATRGGLIWRGELLAMSMGLFRVGVAVGVGLGVGVFLDHQCFLAGLSAHAST